MFTCRKFKATDSIDIWKLLATFWVGVKFFRRIRSSTGERRFFSSHHTFSTWIGEAILEETFEGVVVEVGLGDVIQELVQSLRQSIYDLRVIGRIHHFTRFHL